MLGLSFDNGTISGKKKQKQITL
ncbi:Protein CBG25849 [Caenorhabditis briggsae]|uniref:Protein CBG25849 n=1 Tax=Caenorhabditis briggsae TaxID=6238 RepID=B6IHC0_CAEBR|nr:Protein CBG25849 [Caenorhabditis briggsae]CAR99300.1 Protein CBG25849 [Caenorhabditis briggsae]